LTDETIREQFIRSVPPAMIGPLLGFDRPEIQSAGPVSHAGRRIHERPAGQDFPR